MATSQLFRHHSIRWHGDQVTSLGEKRVKMSGHVPLLSPSHAFAPSSRRVPSMSALPALLAVIRGVRPAQDDTAQHAIGHRSVQFQQGPRYVVAVIRGVRPALAARHITALVRLEHGWASSSCCCTTVRTFRYTCARACDLLWCDLVSTALHDNGTAQHSRAQNQPELSAATTQEARTHGFQRVAA